MFYDFAFDLSDVPLEQRAESFASFFSRMHLTHGRSPAATPAGLP